MFEFVKGEGLIVFVVFRFFFRVVIFVVIGVVGDVVEEIHGVVVSISGFFMGGFGVVFRWFVFGRGDEGAFEKL